jgi:hypothetical protein
MLRWEAPAGAILRLAPAEVPSAGKAVWLAQLAATYRSPAASMPCQSWRRMLLAECVRPLDSREDEIRLR